MKSAVLWKLVVTGLNKSFFFSPFISLAVENDFKAIIPADTIGKGGLSNLSTIHYWASVHVFHLR